ncbi:hypothetical protein [Dactylosporangium darangshiense]|uniref:hypothetical protein n=1 Tax=Dactylosporangium darangshiense TaxID=579108 RepID=UPI00363EA961
MEDTELLPAPDGAGAPADDGPRWLNDDEFRAWIGYRRMRALLDLQLARQLQPTRGCRSPTTTY